MKLLYINSFMRSGSTILGVMLAEAFSARFLGEMRNAQTAILSGRVCVCGSTYSNCEFWGPIIQEAGPFGPTKQFSRLGTWPVLAEGLFRGRAGYLGHVIEKVLPAFRKERNAAAEIYRIYSFAEGLFDPPLLIDSSHRVPQFILLKELLGSNLKLIWLVRDGRAVMASLMRRQSYSAKTAAILWKRFNLLSSVMQSRVLDPDQVVFVRYEDLILDFQGEMDRLSKFISLPLQPRLDECNTIRLDEHHFIGGSSTVRSQNFMKLRLDERWRDELSLRDLSIFEYTAGSLNRRFGYHD